jgi:inner membrane protein
MDNLTHTLAGLLVAELVVAKKPDDPGRVRAAYLVSGIANNLPDFDFLYTRITHGKLGYLLHHRGHTHTVVIALLLGLLLYLAMRKRSRTLLFLALAGPLLHIAMDFGNIYGVHPFWPLYDGWFYGDAMFIVEPYLWAAILPTLLFSVRQRVGRALVGALLALTIVLPFLTGLVATPFAVLVALVTVGLTVVCLRLSRRARAWAGVGAVLGVYAVFSVASLVGASRVSGELGQRFPGEREVEVAVSPLPGNPLCISVLALSVSEEGDLVSRLGRTSLFPGLVPEGGCVLREEGYTARRRTVASPDAGKVKLTSEVRLPLAELRRHASRCDVHAFLRFARAPYFVEQPNGSLVVGDLRFDRNAAIEFAEMELPTTVGECPKRVPAWIPPRDQLLR